MMAWRINGGIKLRQFTSGAQFPATQGNPRWNQQQPQQKNSGKNQENQDAYVRVGRTGKNKIVNPKSDQRYGTAGGEHRTDQTQRVLAEIISGPGPLA
jgi:hypothetical protein